MPKSWEQYSRENDTEGGTAAFFVNMKHSLWSADVETWEEEAPEVLRHMRMLYNNTLLLTLASQKEIRYGVVTITGTCECEDAPGELSAVGHFEQRWDDDPPDIVYFELQATSVADLLKKVDEQEAILIEIGNR